MKVRKAIAAMRRESDWQQRLTLANDDFPGTPYDDFFLGATESWLDAHHEDRQSLKKTVAGLLAKKWASGDPSVIDPGTVKLCKEEASEFFTQAGELLSEAVIKGDSTTLRKMADALDEWVKHTPQPDRLRGAIVQESAICKLLNHPFTMRLLVSKLKGYKVPVDESTRRRARTICAELGIKLVGKPGRPK